MIAVQLQYVIQTCKTQVSLLKKMVEEFDYGEGNRAAKCPWHLFSEQWIRTDPKSLDLYIDYLGQVKCSASPCMHFLRRNQSIRGIFYLSQCNISDQPHEAMSWSSYQHLLRSNRCQCSATYLLKLIPWPVSQRIVLAGSQKESTNSILLGDLVCVWECMHASTPKGQQYIGIPGKAKLLAGVQHSLGTWPLQHSKIAYLFPPVIFALWYKQRLRCALGPCGLLMVYRFSLLRLFVWKCWYWKRIRRNCVT